MKRAKCERCGRVYDGTIQILEFRAEDGIYRACSKCIEKVGAARTDRERNELIRQFKVKECEGLN